MVLSMRRMSTVAEEGKEESKKGRVIKFGWIEVIGKKIPPFSQIIYSPLVPRAHAIVSVEIN